MSARGGAEANLRRRRRRWIRGRRRRHEATMTVVEHLGELRTRLIASLGAFLALSAIAWLFYDPLLTLLKAPLCSVDSDLLGEGGCDLVFTGALQGFQFRLKVTALAGLVAASPVWLYQAYAFVVPAMTPREKRYSVPFVITAVVLFAAGMVFAYTMLPRGLAFLLRIGGEGLTPLLIANEYLNFVGFMFIAFGLAFELPLILVFLGLAGVLSVQQLRAHRRTAIVAIAALAAVATPSQDPYTMLAMAVPLYGLYEVTIVILALIERRRARAESL